jgi:hypothetical protein
LREDNRILERLGLDVLVATASVDARTWRGARMTWIAAIVVAASLIATADQGVRSAVVARP